MLDRKYATKRPSLDKTLLKILNSVSENFNDEFRNFLVKNSDNKVLPNVVFITDKDDNLIAIQAKETLPNVNNPTSEIEFFTNVEYTPNELNIQTVEYRLRYVLSLYDAKFNDVSKINHKNEFDNKFVPDITKDLVHNYLKDNNHNNPSKISGEIHNPLVKGNSTTSLFPSINPSPKMESAKDSTDETIDDPKKKESMVDKINQYKDLYGNITKESVAKEMKENDDRKRRLKLFKIENPGESITRSIAQRKSWLENKVSRKLKLKTKPKDSKDELRSSRLKEKNKIKKEILKDDK